MCYQLQYTVVFNVLIVSLQRMNHIMTGSQNNLHTNGKHWTGMINLLKNKLQLLISIIEILQKDMQSRKYIYIMLMLMEKEGSERRSLSEPDIVVTTSTSRG